MFWRPPSRSNRARLFPKRVKNTSLQSRLKTFPSVTLEGNNCSPICSWSLNRGQQRVSLAQREQGRLLSSASCCGLLNRKRATLRGAGTRWRHGICKPCARQLRWWTSTSPCSQQAYWRTFATEGLKQRTLRSSRLLKLLRPQPSSQVCHWGGTRLSAREVTVCQAVNVNGWPSPEPCSRMRRCSSLTKPLRPLTTKQRRPCSVPFNAYRKAGRPWSSLTVCQPSATLIVSWFLTTGLWLRTVRTTSWLSKEESTLGCGWCKPVTPNNR